MSKAAVRHLAKVDKVLARTLKKVGPMALRLKEAHSPYEALLESIVYQQLTGKAAATILGRVLAIYGAASTGARKRKFPTPAQILDTPDERLRAAGLSRAKTAAIKDLALKAREGIVPSHRQILKMDDEEIVERLTQIRGIGRWTVEMLLIFKLGRQDVLPSTDYGVRKGFMVAYARKDLPTPKELLAHGERWRPYRTAASWYLWRVLDFEKLRLTKKKRAPRP